ncbi:MAG: hypothetical protein KDD61_04070 [Bdellovibrionales bacterium]|nr:hypothetical protein [Bdellovibrionales bacterium]
MKGLCLFFFLSILVSLSSQAATNLQRSQPQPIKTEVSPISETVSTEVPSEKPSFVSQSRWSIKGLIDIPSNEMLISVDEGRSSINATEKRIQYIPGSTTQYGLQLGYGPFFWSYKGSVFSESSDHAQTYGASRFHNLQFDFVGSRWGFHLHHQVYKGFYADLNALSGITIQESDSLTTSATGPSQKAAASGASIIQRPDIENSSDEVRIFYRLPVFDPRRNDAVFDLSDEFRGFGLTLLSDVYVNVSQFSGAYSLIPVSYHSQFGAVKDLREISTRTIGITFGGKLDWYLSEKSDFFFLMSLGGGVQFQESVYDQKSDSQIQLSKAVQFQTGYEYLGDHHFTGVSFAIHLITSEVEPVKLDFITTQLVGYYGYRF